MPMPNRIKGKNSYRYAYQGQEKDIETDKEAFQLRLWDGRIGRWLTTDPYGQYSSPYLGMGNNPTNGVDPDGGLFGRIRAWFYKLTHGGSIMKNEFDKWVWASDTKLSGNNAGGYMSSDLEMKSFGYGGFGKFHRKSSEVFITGKVDLGFANHGFDTGLLGGGIKIATSDLLNFNLGGKKKYGGSWEWNNNYKNYKDSDKPYTGTMFGIDIESPYGDYGYNASLKGVSPFSEKYNHSKPQLSVNHNVYAGYAVLRLHGLDISKKGVGISLNLEENFGASFFIGGTVNMGGKIEGYWEF